jgi:hypothetical protein
MKIDAMYHTIRAASEVSGCKEFLVIGSQSILGHCFEKGQDFSFNESMEIDLIPIPESENNSDAVEIIGEMSQFHITFGYYAHGVEKKTAIFPDGWEQRLLKQKYESPYGYTVQIYFPSVEDIVLAKLAAGRENDIEFVRKVFQEGMVNDSIIEELCRKMPLERIGAEKFALLRKRLSMEIERVQSFGLSY